MPVRDRLPECSAPAMRQKVQQLLQYAVKGVQENSTGAGTQGVLQWAWGQLKRSLAQGVDSADANGNVSGAAGGAGVRSLALVMICASQNERCMHACQILKGIVTVLALVLLPVEAGFICYGHLVFRRQYCLISRK
jgi:hypothetical protein